MFNKMKLQKILNKDSIQGYQIISPSKEFKKKFPKKFIYSLMINDKLLTGCNSTLPILIQLPITRGFIFTYNNKLPKTIGFNDKDILQNSTYPECLDQFYPSSNNDIDLILKCLPKQTLEITPAFNEELVIRTNSLRMFKRKDYNDAISNPKNIDKEIQKNIMELINTNLKKYDNVEEWIEHVIKKCPTGCDGYPVKFFNEITKSNLNNSVTKNQVFVTYDYRPYKWGNSFDTDYKFENLVSVAIEDAFESPDLNITIYNNYNNIINRMKEILDKDKLPYKYDNKKNSISLDLKTLRKLDMEYQLTDFL